MPPGRGLPQTLPRSSKTHSVAEPSGSAELITRGGVVAFPATERHGRGAIPYDDCLIVPTSAWSHPRLLAFPDIAVDRIESAALIPVNAPFGRAVLAIGRLQPLSFDPCQTVQFDLISFGLGAAV